MLTYSFNDIGNTPLYLHLYQCIKNDILLGTLLAGQKLPSKRSFARNLNVSIITIENAYSQLIAEGYVYSLPKKGFFVADLQSIPHAHVPATPSAAAKAPSASVVCKESLPPLIADFTSNQTSAALFPFSTWAKISREVLARYPSQLLTNPPCGGILPLREAIAKHLKEFRGMEVSPQQIIIGAGTEYLYGLLIQLLGFEKHYAVEDPGYSKISQIYQSHCISCDHISMDSMGVKIAELNSKLIDIVHISPSHHFPTGIIMPIRRRYELLAWASASADRYIIEDDYDSEFRLNGQPIPTLQSIDVQEKVIYINTFTKTLASTIRISYMVLPPHLAAVFHTKLAFYSCTVSNFEQYTLAHFISEGYFEKHLNRMRNHYRNKRDKLLSLLEKSPLSSHITISEENAGLHFLLKIHTTLSEEEFLYKLKQEGIQLSSLSQYYQTPPKEAAHTFVMNYSNADEDTMEQAIAKIYELL